MSFFDIYHSTVKSTFSIISKAQSQKNIRTFGCTMFLSVDHVLGDIPFYCDITVDDEYSLVRCLVVKCIVIKCKVQLL